MVKDFFECLVEFLNQNEDVKSVFQGRIHPLLMGRKPILPSLVYSPISERHHEALQGETGYKTIKVQFSIYADSFKSARQNSRIVRKVFKDFSGRMGGIHVESCHAILDNIIFQDDRTNFDLESFCGVLEIEFNFKEGE